MSYRHDFSLREAATLAASHPISALGYYPERILRYLENKRNWKVSKMAGEKYLAVKGETTLVLRKSYLWVLLHESPFWGQQYLPANFSIKGKTVLDVGAGCGETAYFYLRSGAAKVISIEKDYDACYLLWQNARANKWPCTPLNRAFNLQDLDLAFDLMKMDIEGGERELAELPAGEGLPSTILECHSEQIRVKLQARFPDLLVKSRHPIYETKILSNCG